MHLLSTIAGLFVTKVYASPYFGLYCDALGTYCGDGKAFIRHLAARTANVLVIPTLGGIAVIAVLWASIKMISSGGDDQGKEDAKKIIIAAAVGIGFSCCWYCYREVVLRSSAAYGEWIGMVWLRMQKSESRKQKEMAD